MFSEWIEQQYRDLAKNIPAETLKLLNLAAEYEGFKSPAAYVEYLATESLKRYRGDLRFGRWLQKRGADRSFNERSGSVSTASAEAALHPQGS